MTLTVSSFKRLGAFIGLTFLTLAILTGCNPQASAQAQAEAYIRAHVSELSPTSAVLGGTFYVTDITWEDSDTALVSYEDGHIALKGRTNIVSNNNSIGVTTFTIIDAGGMGQSSSAAMSEDSSRSAGSEMSATTSSSMAMSSTGMRPLSLEGEFCGGIAAFQCASGLHCKYDGTYPDAGGTCVR